MRATKKAQLAVGSGLQSMNRCISKETGEREDAAMFRPHPEPALLTAPTRRYAYCGTKQSDVPACPSQLPRP